MVKIRMYVPSRNKAILALAIVLVFALIYFVKKTFIAATVNGSPIMKSAVNGELQKRYGRSVLDSLITEKLIIQEAQNQGITVSQQEIDEEIAKIEESVKKQGQTLESVLALQGMTKIELSGQIKIQKLIEKLLGDKVTVTDSELQEYIKNNEESLKTVSSDLKEVENYVKDLLKQQKLSGAFQAWIDGIRQKATVNYLISY